MKRSKRTLKIGVLLLLVNSLFGWGALALCSLLAIRTELVIFYHIGLLLYALSWVMLGVGLYLAGWEGVRYARQWRRELFAQWSRIFRHTSPTRDIEP